MLYVTHLLNGLLMLALPVGLGIYLTRKFGFGWRLWWIGAATFILSQMGHLPFNALLTLLFERNLLPSPPQNWQMPFNAIILGLSAGVWEELTRYAVYRWWAKDARTWRQGVLLGAGHGGIEAVVLGILVLITYYFMVSMRGADLTRTLPANQVALAQEQIQAYWSAPWYEALLGALERGFALTLQISFSVLVLQTFTRGQKRWLWLAVFWHALVDGLAVLALHLGGAYIAETLVAASCLIGLGIIFALRQPESMTSTPSEPPSRPISTPRIPPRIEETLENLEETRYN